MLFRLTAFLSAIAGAGSLFWGFLLHYPDWAKLLLLIPGILYFVACRLLSRGRIVGSIFSGAAAGAELAFSVHVYFDWEYIIHLYFLVPFALLVISATGATLIRSGRNESSKSEREKAYLVSTRPV